MKAYVIRTYTIELFDKRGKKLDESFTVDHDGVTGSTFKQYWTRYAKMFINPRTETISVN